MLVITLAPSVLIGSFWNLYVKVAGDKNSNEFENRLRRPTYHRVMSLLIAENADFWPCHHSSPFSFDQNFLKLICKVAGDKTSDEFENRHSRPIFLRVTFLWLLKMLIFYLVITVAPSVLIGTYWNLYVRWLWIKISDEFENRPSQPIYHRVTSLWLLKMPIFYLVIIVALSVLIRSFWNLYVRWLGIKPQMSSNTCQVRPLIIEYLPFDCWKCRFLTLSSP